MKHLILFIAFFSLCTVAQAQSQADINKAKAYYFQAEEAITAEEWDKALQLVNEAEKLSGQNGAPLEAVRVKAYFGMKEYEKAKTALNTFFTMSASANFTKEMSEYLLKVDELIHKEKERIAREEEAARIKKEKLAGIDVHAVAFKTGKKLRNAIKRNIENANILGKHFKTSLYYRTRAGGKRTNIYLEAADEFRIRSSTNFFYHISVNCKSSNDDNGYGGISSYPDVYFSGKSIQISSGEGFTIPDRCVSFPGSYFNDYNKLAKALRNRIKQAMQNVADDFSSAISMSYNLTENEKLAYEKNSEAFKAKVMEVLEAEDNYDLNQITTSKWKAIFDKALALHDDGKHAKTIPLYTKVIELKPDYRLAYSNRGTARRVVKDYEGSLQDLNKSISIMPGYYAYRQKGFTLYYGFKDYDKAIEAFTTALKYASNAQLSGLYHWIGYCYHKLKNWNEAIKAYEKGINLTTEDADIFADYANALAESGRQLDKAEKMILKALKEAPDNVYRLDTAGWVYYKKTDYSKASQYLQAAINTGEADARTHEHMGDVLAKLTRFKQAKTHWQKACDMGSETACDKLNSKANTLVSDSTLTFKHTIPKIIGGIKELYKHISYPSQAVQGNIEGTVRLTFLVEPDGTVSNISVINDIGGGCAEAAIAGLKKVRFLPGMQAGKPVRAKFELPVTFSLD